MGSNGSLLYITATLAAIMHLQISGIHGTEASYSVLFKGAFNDSLVSDITITLQKAEELVNKGLGSRLSCTCSNYTLSGNELSSERTMRVDVSCYHELSLLSLDQATNNLYKAVSVGMSLESSGVSMLSRLPIYFNGEVFNPEELTKVEVIIIAVTVSVSIVFFLSAMLIILKIQQASEAKRARSAVSPSTTTPTSLPEKDDDSILGNIEEQTNPSSIHQLRRMTLADIAPRRGSNKNITQWQPCDFYADAVKHEDLLELRVKQRIYLFNDDRSFTKLFAFSTDLNGTMQKLRCEIQIKIKKKLGTTQFIFYNQDLKMVTPQSECSYLVASIYEAPTIIIKLLQGQEKEIHGWMLCPCGNAGKHECNCTKQLYCTRFCQQSCGTHSDTCNTVLKILPKGK